MFEKSGMIKLTSKTYGLCVGIIFLSKYLKFKLYDYLVVFLCSKNSFDFKYSSLMKVSGLGSLTSNYHNMCFYATIALFFKLFRLLNKTSGLTVISKRLYESGILKSSNRK